MPRTRNPYPADFHELHIPEPSAVIRLTQPKKAEAISRTKLPKGALSDKTHTFLSPA